MSAYIFYHNLHIKAVRFLPFQTFLLRSQGNGIIALTKLVPLSRVLLHPLLARLIAQKRSAPRGRAHPLGIKHCLLWLIFLHSNYFSVTANENAKLRVGC